MDCVLRVGDLRDSDMLARRVAMLPQVTCAAPAYIARHGHPRDIASLGGHRMVGFRSSLTGAVLPLEFQTGGGVQSINLPTSLIVNGADSFAAAARHGLGLIQVLRYHVAEDLARGDLLALLPDHPPPALPVSLLHPCNRLLSPRARLFMDWLAAIFRDAAD